jgi:hypothetical protein
VRISHWWIEEDGREIGWAVPSKRETRASKGHCDPLWACVVPRGWEWLDCSDNVGASDGIYVIRKKKSAH